MRVSRLSAAAAAALVAAAAATAALPRVHAQPAAAQPAASVTATPDWPMAGQNSHNTRDAATEQAIGPGNVATLRPKWTLTTGGDVAATPTVSNGVVYVPDLGGNLWAVDAGTGAVIWSKRVGGYTGAPGDSSRTSPAVYGSEIVIGNGFQTSAVTTRVGAWVMGIDAATGALRWKTQVDTNPYAMITGSPVIDQGVIYVGVSSSEEVIPRIKHTFRGSVVALDAQTGKILWQTYTAPPGYTGNAVWGSTPAVDHTTGLVYVGTGNNYTVPPGVCTSPEQTGCTPPAANDYSDSVLALRLSTGAVAWAHRTLSADEWTAATPQGPDWDFGSGPNLYPADVNGSPRTAIDAATGRILRQTADPQHAADLGFVSTANGVVYGSSDAVSGDNMYALNAATGAVEWGYPSGGSVISGAAVANGTVYWGSGYYVGSDNNKLYAFALPGG